MTQLPTSSVHPPPPQPSRANVRTAHDESGFTLVEVLIALALTTLILASLLGAFRLGRRAWEGLDALEHRGSIAAVQDFLGETLARAEPILVRNPDGHLSVPFTGTRDRISFVVNMRGHGMLGGLYVVDITVEAAGDGRTRDLVIGQTWFRPGASPQPPQQRRVLMRGIESASWRYFGARPTNSPGWHDSWSGTLPRLVSFEFLPGRPNAKPISSTIELRLLPK